MCIRDSFSTDATFGEDDDYAGDDATFGGAEPDILPPPVEEPEPGGGQAGMDNPLYGDNPLTYNVTDLDPYKFITSPATMYPNLFKDGGMIGFRPLGYANGGMVMADDGTMSPRPLGYANGGMPRGYDNGGEAVAVNRQTVQDFMEQLRSAPVESLNDYMYRNLDALKMAAQDPAFAEQLGEVMAQTGFDEHMRQLMAGSPPAPGLGGPVSEQMPPPPPQMRPPQMRPPQMPPPQMPPPQVPMAMNRGGILSLRRM
jgi:hypothetical protein